MATVGVIDAKVGLDLAPLNAASRKAKAKFQEISQSMITAFKTTAVVGGAALAGIGYKAIKLGSDFEETNSKFKTAFKGIEEQAFATAKTLTDGFAMSNLEAQRLLSSTGDLLKGFGFSATAALDLSANVQMLAADLASYNNLQGGTQRASEILTKALLGERDALVSLGIKISDADVQQRLLEKGQKGLTGTARLSAIAMATFELAVQQSGDAMGDMERTSGSFANQVKRLQANIKNVAESGQKLLLIATDVIKMLNLNFMNKDFMDRIKTAAVGLMGVVGTIALIGGTIALVSNPMVQLVAVSALVAKGIESNFLGLKTVFDWLGERMRNLLSYVLSINDMIKKGQLDASSKLLGSSQKTLMQPDAKDNNVTKQLFALDDLTKALDNIGVAYGDTIAKAYSEIEKKGKLVDFATPIRSLYQEAFSEMNSSYDDVIDNMIKKTEAPLETAFTSTVDFAKTVFLDGFGSIGESVEEMFDRLFGRINFEAQAREMAANFMSEAEKAAREMEKSFKMRSGKITDTDTRQEDYTISDSLKMREEAVANAQRLSETIGKTEIQFIEIQQSLADTLSSISGSFYSLGHDLKSNFLSTLGDVVSGVQTIMRNLQIANFTSMAGIGGVLGIVAGVVGIGASLFGDKESKQREDTRIIENTREVKRNTEAMQGLNNALFNISRNVQVDVLRARTAVVNPATGVR